MTTCKDYLQDDVDLSGRDISIFNDPAEILSKVLSNTVKKLEKSERQLKSAKMIIEDQGNKISMLKNEINNLRGHIEYRIGSELR